MVHASADDLIIQDLHRHWQLRSMDLDDLQQLLNLRFCLPDVPLRKVAAAGAAPQKVGGGFIIFSSSNGSLIKPDTLLMWAYAAHSCICAETFSEKGGA